LFHSSPSHGRLSQATFLMRFGGGVSQQTVESVDELMVDVRERQVPKQHLTAPTPQLISTECAKTFTVSQEPRCPAPIQTATGSCHTPSLDDSPTRWTDHHASFHRFLKLHLVGRLSPSRWAYELRVVSVCIVVGVCFLVSLRGCDSERRLPEAFAVKAVNIETFSACKQHEIVLTIS
jgi:hypothetical protein